MSGRATSAPIDGTRMLRATTLIVSLLSCTGIYCAYQPQIDALALRLQDDESELRSGDIAFSELPRLRVEQAVLARRYRGAFERAGEATFLRHLASTVRGHNVTLVSTSVAQDTTAGSNGSNRTLFEATHATLELRGRYVDLLAAVADLSAGAEMVGVDTPALRRDGDAIVASVPVTLSEPQSGGAP
jgi:hypothetical protein